jgi:hypothetical protein
MICGSNSIKLFSLVGDFMAQPSEQCSRWHSHRRAGFVKIELVSSSFIFVNNKPININYDL